MTACLGSPRCEYAPSMVTLHDGQVVCSNCPLWAAECEAKRLLTYRLPERREALRERDKIRSGPVMDKLRELMSKIHADRKK